jgi:hypothetical protein
VVIEHHNFDRRILDARFENSNPVGLLGIDKHEPSDLRELDVLEFADIEVVYGEKISDGLLASSGQDQLRFWKEFACGNHGGQAIEIRVAMRGNDFHVCILAASHQS